MAIVNEKEDFGKFLNMINKIMNIMASNKVTISINENISRGIIISPRFDERRSKTKKAPSMNGFKIYTKLLIFIILSVLSDYILHLLNYQNYKNYY